MSIQYYSPRRRAIMRRGDLIDHLELFEMWGWECHLCGKIIDRMIRFPEKMAATVDHIIPISKGGTHTWANVAPAHALCNEIKADRLIPVFLTRQPLVPSVTLAPCRAFGLLA